LSTLRIVFFLLIIYNISNAQQKFELAKITANHKAIELNPTPQSIELFSKNNDLLVEFKPIAGDSISYKYQLTNYELDWTESKYPIAKYMNLPQGNYQLFVIGRQKDKEIAHYYLDIIVKKSLTEAWWFYPMLAIYALLLVGGGIYLFFLYNFRQKMKLQKLRNKIAADLHDEVGSTLNSIGISSKIIQRKIVNLSPEMENILSQIVTDSEETISTIRDTVWALNSENNNLHTLISKIKQFSTQILDNKGINLIFENEINANKVVKLDINQQKNFYLIAKEAVNNIAKHSEASLAKMKFTSNKSTILFEISDNGKGFNLTQNTEGNGLKNFKKRANESFMDLKIESKIGKGTSLKLEVDII
jgi:two-component sensor histidine kinase